MTRREWRLLVAFTVFVAAAVTPVAVVMRLTASCQARAAADETTVYTSRMWTDGDLGGIGAYEDIHWQQRVLGEDCRPLRESRVYEYTALLTLRADDAAALEERCDWVPVRPVDGEGMIGNAKIRPPLAALLPRGVHWSTCDRYRASGLGRYTGTLYLDAEHRLVYGRFSPA